MEPLLKILAKKGFPREKNESINTYLTRAETALGIALSDVNRTYHLARYQKNLSQKPYVSLKKEIAKTVRILRRHK